MRSFVIAAVAALAFAAAAHAGGGYGSSTTSTYGYKTPSSATLAGQQRPPAPPKCPAKTKRCGAACVALNKTCHP